MEELRDHGTKRAARHDNRALSSEGSARANGNGRRNRLQNGHPGLDLATLQQNGFNRFWNAVTADTLGAVARHQADDETADHRHDNLQPAEVVARGRNHRSAPALIEKQVGENSNQPQQSEGDEGAEDADADRQQGDRYHLGW